MLPVFLIGGGGDHPGSADTYGRFVRAATRDGLCRIALVVAEDDPTEADDIYASTRAIFANQGVSADQMTGLFLTSTTALTTAQITAAKPTGLFVCGGTTPLYQQALCEDPSWLDYLQTRGLPYGGVSAGAAVAATTAIVGGWRAQRGVTARPILFQGASEGRDLLDVRSGLGLVPFSVEVHASQWGTLTRLVHTLDLGLVTEGWAIDEATLLQVDEAGLQVHGLGQAYHLRRDEQGAICLMVHGAPDRVSWQD
jgi:cyanophycinase